MTGIYATSNKVVSSSLSNQRSKTGPNKGQSKAKGWEVGDSKEELKMKEDQQQHQYRRKFTGPTVYLLLLALSYSLGYMSGSSSSSSTTATNTNIATEQESLHLLQPRTESNQTFQNTAEPSGRGNSCTAISQSETDHYQFSTQCGAPIPSEHVRQKILDGLFNGSSPFVGFPPPHAVPYLRQKRIKGWGSNGAVFENLIRKVRPTTIIEVGTFLGASTIHMAQVAKGLGLHHTQIICVDDFRGWAGFRDLITGVPMINGDVTLLYQFMQNVAHFNVTDMVLPLPFSSASTLEKLCEYGVFGDLIEVDAGHDFHSAWSDINRAYKILRPGGVIFGHDYFTAADKRGVRRAVNLFARLKSLRILLDGQHWVIHSDA
ncbi:uncharacterized protein LOC122081764 [Macadamia integrifolia]|uniref:uncharacterized protein LOC122081764 n=1 Tax=Macadamia integrifolia TaxID=60698 RepID=UPI001C4FBC66|nr:uncharacterized protein LOC122081764 [Macadamia integrifolia]